MRILVIDDEQSILKLISQILTRHGAEVVTAVGGESGLHHALAGDYTLILLDVDMPDRNGWSVLEELRKQQITTPVLLLTAFAAVDDRVKGFHLGADDYLVKPFDHRELLGRVQAITRRATPPNRIIAGDLNICLDTRDVTRAGKSLHLSPHEFGVLLLLVRKKGEVVTHLEIASQILHRKQLGISNAVEVLIRRLRLKVDARFHSPRIRTIRGQGYVFVNDPVKLSELPPSQGAHAS